MKIMYRFCNKIDEHRQEIYKKIGIHLEINKCSCFVLAESDPKFEKVMALPEEMRCVSFVSTKFSKIDLNNARHIRIGTDWHHGYPQPEDDFKYINQVYEITRFCWTCGQKRIQTNPFQMKKEPKWGKKHILQMYWIFGNLFVKPEIWEQVFKPFGVGAREVLHYKKNTPLETVVQLIIPELNIHHKLDGCEKETCPVCKRDKYSPICRGFIPSLNAIPNAPIFKTADYFGYGLEAYNLILVNQELYQCIVKHKLRGLYYKAVAK
jgi:hypothetical protein